MIVELTSESTEAIDRGQKKDLYARVLRVPFYAIFDPFSGRLDAFRLVEREYRPIEPDARGFLRCEPLGLWLGVREGTRQGIHAPWLRWIDDAGQVLPEPAESAAVERHRAEVEAERARKEAERADRAEAELARLREELARRS